MEWLLITTIGRNPGDEWIRIGVQNLISKVDSQARFILLDKESPSLIKTVVNFDKCVWCGMPVFWSHDENKNNNMPWWNELMLGWVSERKNDFLVLGAGSFFPWDLPQETIVYKDLLEKSARDVIERSFFVTARDSFVSTMTKTNIPAMVCPAAFSILGFEQNNELKIANLMPEGSHFKEFNPGESLIWELKKHRIAEILRENGFVFVAHNLLEYQFAQENRWKDIILYNGDPYGLLKYYGRCGKYFGNRIHGAIVARGNNADVWSIGYDSRQEAVRISGAKVSRPSELDYDQIEKWATEPIKAKPFDMEFHFNQQLEIVKKFADAKDQTNVQLRNENLQNILAE